MADAKAQPLVALLKKWDECSCDPEIPRSQQNDYAEFREELETALEAQRQHLLKEAKRQAFDAAPYSAGVVDGLRLAAEMLKVER